MEATKAARARVASDEVENHAVVYLITLYCGATIRIVLNKNVTLAQYCVKALSKLLRRQKITVELGVT